MTGYTKHKTESAFCEKAAIGLAQAMIFPLVFILLAYFLCAVVA